MHILKEMTQGFDEKWLKTYLGKFGARSRAKEKVSHPPILDLEDRFKNSWERAYAGHLDLLKSTGEIRWWEYECWGFRLAEKTFHYPDFPVVLRNGSLEIHEVKGHKKQAWLIKFKTCREMYPFLTWRCFQKKDGRWEEINV